jgi:maltose/moltooligosaccharide transporter
MDRLTEEQPRLGFPEIWNMNFGFLGIQFGWGLQMANMSAIYTKLGAHPDRIPLLWLAGSVTGLVVQPIVGAMSDRTWNRLGRRRPYFLAGAILSSIALFVMPSSPALWAAAALLWILDASINVSMEPFRAFVADKLPVSQRAAGFLMQSFFIGLGATLANMLPYILSRSGVTGQAVNGVPLTVLYSFRIGAAAFLLAVLWTIVRTRENPPSDLAAFERRKRETVGLAAGAREIADAVRAMPRTMRQLALTQFVTWLGLFCLWLFFGLAIAEHVFRAADKSSPLFDRATEWGGVCFAAYSAVCFVVAPLLPALAARLGRTRLHGLCLACGGIGMLSVGAIHSPNLLLLSMAGVGIAWASILAMPYAILANALPPERTGVYMGIFNFFIVLPEITASLTFQPLVKHVFGDDPLKVVLLGGVCLLLAAGLATRVSDSPETAASEPREAALTNARGASEPA